MKNPRPSVFKTYLLFFLMLMPCTIFALRSDAAQTAHFAADKVLFNEHDGKTIYLGHVRMQQGTTHLMADEVIVYRDKEGGTDKVVATGNPVHYVTLPDDQKEPLDALGDKIEYYPKKHQAIIIGHGQVLQAKNSLKGSYIVYDMAKQTLSSIPSSVSSHPEEKTLIILQPRDMPGKKPS